MMKTLPACLLLILLTTSCWKENKNTVTGYAPVYGNASDLKSIVLTTAQPIENGGKIYVYNNILYQVETGKGIHIIDITNPESPVMKGFLNVSGAQELAVKDNMIMTNNMRDLVILSITNNQVSTVRRLPDTFKYIFNNSLPPEAGMFECPDPTKGIVIGWQKKTLRNPSCSY
ncbi:MAG: hypothetical protein ACK5NK_03780 [Niabella sp.]